jgi:hypothetical protein
MRSRWVAVLTVLLAAIPAAAHACGVDRWPPKVLADPTASLINAALHPTTIASLTALPPPSSLPYDVRISPVETSIYELRNVTLQTVRPSGDGDYVLVLRDGTKTMIAESPDPGCISGPYAQRSDAAHQAIAQRFGGVNHVVTANLPVSLTGVGFFDYIVSSPDNPGEAPNGIEIHPILSIAFEQPAPSPASIAQRSTLTVATGNTPFSFAPSALSAPATLFSAYHESGPISLEMDPVASGTRTNETLSYAANYAGANFGWISAAGAPGLTSWPAQNYTVTLNVTAPNPALSITEVKVFRVDSNGGPSEYGLSVVGDLKVSQPLASVGTLTFNVPGSAQNASASDRLGVKFYVANPSSQAQSFSYDAGTSTLSSFGTGSGAPPPTPVPTAMPTSPPTATPTPSPTATPAGTSYESKILDDNPSQYYTLGDAGGSVAHDSSTNAQNGNYVGSVSYQQPGPLLNEPSTSIGLSGGSSSAGVALPSPNAPAGSSYSIEIWVYPILGSTDMTIWGASGTHRLLLTPSAVLLSQFNGNLYSKGALSPKAWNDVTFVYDASAQTESYYIDGNFDSSATLASSAAAFTSPYYLGQYDTGKYYKWDGRLAQAAVYHYALTPAQIAGHYTSAGYTVPSGSATPVPAIPGCSGYRWPIKVAADANASQISTVPQPATIAQLIALPSPSPNPSAPRIQGVETTTYQLTNVTLQEIFQNPDGDYHMVLRDGSGNTMIAESPNPQCAQQSRFQSQITQVRSAIDAQLQVITDDFPNLTVTVQGVGFFDQYAQLPGQAPNAVELHTLTGICFGANCSISGASPSPAPAPS